MASVAQVNSPDPTATAATAVPAPTSEPAPAPKSASEPTQAPATPKPVPTIESVVPDSDLAILQIQDMAGLMDQVLNSPELMSCLAGALGFSAMTSLSRREPTPVEMESIKPCFSEGQLDSLAGGTAGVVSSPTTSPTPTPEPVRKSIETLLNETQTALSRPEGVPWYNGPLFDAHMHMNGVTNSFMGGTFTTSDVLRMMDRHNMVGGVGFWVPPVFGRQSEVDLLNKSISEVDHRLASLMIPIPFELGFDFGFLGFAEGTYTRDLLDEWYPPNGPFDGFGEIPFYMDKLLGINPGDSQLDDIYPLVAESSGVMMAHPSEFQTAEDWAAVMSKYPEITFLFHGLKDFHGNGPDERAAILELLDTYEGDNLFYTIDVGPLLHTLEIGNGRSIGMDSESGEELASLVNSVDRQKLAEHVYSDYSQEVIDHPDRLLFGTDFLSAWHFEGAGNDVIIDFARRFIGLLPEELQEDFAYKNGLDAFRKHLD